MAHAGKHPSSNYFYIGSGATPTTSAHVVVDNIGNVGIGTSSPSGIFHLKDASSSFMFKDVSGNAKIFLDGSNGDFAGGDYMEIEVDSSPNLMFKKANSELMRIDSIGNVLVGNSTAPSAASANAPALLVSGPNDATIQLSRENATAGGGAIQSAAGAGLVFYTHTGAVGSESYSERMRIDSGGNAYFLNVLRVVAAVSDNPTANSATSDEGIELNLDHIIAVRDSAPTIYINRIGTDGTLVNFHAQGNLEGYISVSGTTVSFNGGHLSRWSRLADDSKDTSIVKGTVMTNLDEMVEWSHETTYWTDEDELPVDEDGNPTVSVGDVKTAAYVEDNEQLNKMAVSSVEGDANVAGVFVNWDSDDDDFNDMNIAMTGDMVIRIASGTTVQRGDLLMSAGDGTAKPQGDDIVRSKTIAKVTSTHVSHTYDDGSYLVPCVLMAC